MSIESDESSLEEYPEDLGGALENPQEEVKDMHYDEVYELNESDEEDIPSNPEDQVPAEIHAGSSQGSDFSNGSQDMMNPKAFQQLQYSGQFKENPDTEEDGPAVKGAYNPEDYANLAASSEIKELFQYIQRYKPHHLELDTKLKPFIPEFIPAAGEVDAFMKIAKPDGKEELLGLAVLDEPALNQSDPALLELTLKPLLKRPGTDGGTAVVRSIESADKNPKQISRWIQSIGEVHRNKPPPTVNFSKDMPDLDTLMDVWPPDVEELLEHVELPGPAMDVDLGTYARMVCAVLDIPVHSLGNGKSLVESAYLLFSLYSEFKTNPHLKTNMMGYDQMQF